VARGSRRPHPHAELVPDSDDGGAYARIVNDICVERFFNVRTTSTVDGHVEFIPRAQIQQWATDNFNFARPADMIRIPRLFSEMRNDPTVIPPRFG